MTFAKKKVIALLLVAIMTMSFLMPVVLADPNKIPPGHFKGKAYWKVSFPDIDETLEWAQLAIDRLYAKGIFTGYPGGIFKPRNNVTHMEAIIMSLRVMGWEREVKNTKIIPQDLEKLNLSWNEGYYYVALAVQKGLIKPEELRNFNPNAPAKRYEIARYIVRAIGKEEEAQKHMDEKLSFKDVNAIPEDVIGYVYIMVDLELMVGDSNNKFKPQEPITRAEMAVMLNRLDDSLEDDNKLVGTIKDIDTKKLTITIQNSFGTKNYDVKEGAPVYLDNKYRSLEDLRIGDKVELLLDDNGKVIFIQTVDKTDRVTTSKKGIIIDVDDSKKTISLFANGKDLQKGYYGTLKVSDIEGRHYELDTPKGRYVLTGSPRKLRELEDYLNEEIVVIGELSKDVSIYMRGPIIEVEDFYDVETKHIEKYDIDKNTKITIDGKSKYSLSAVEIGDFAEVRAYEDGVCIEVYVKSLEKAIKGLEKNKDGKRNVKIEGKVISISSDNQLTIETEDGRFTITIDSKVKLKGLRRIKDIEKGMKLELKIENNKIVEIEVDD